MTTKINNYNAIAEELTNMLIDLDVDHNDFQIDIYLYIREDGNAYLYQFTNVGGNSWLDDDHILVYQDKPHYDDIPFDEDGNTISDADYRDYLEEFRADYMDTAWNALDDAEIEPA